MVRKLGKFYLQLAGFCLGVGATAMFMVAPVGFLPVPWNTYIGIPWLVACILAIIGFIYVVGGAEEQKYGRR